MSNANRERAAHNTHIPLYLYQVLEEEYESLHGPIPAAVQACLPNTADASKPQAITSTGGWEFDTGHIKARKDFAAALLGEDTEELPNTAGPYDRAKKELIAYLRGRIAHGALKPPPNNVSGQPPKDSKFDVLAGELEHWLNQTILRDAELYSDSRFSYRRLSDETRGLLSLRSEGVAFGDTDIKHLNRLLLEDAFPKIFNRISDIRIAALHTLLHGKEQAALCLSGGGIRSGTFALGLIQGLARHGLLGKFDYLSTVSGGGYTGSWLTAWIHRHPEGLAGVMRDLSYGDTKKVDPDPAPLQYLRQYSNFITPKVGLLTADTWSFVGIYLRNTFLNLLVFIPLLLSVLMIPRLLLALTLMQPEADGATGQPPPWDIFRLGLARVPHRYVFLTLGVLLGSWALAYIIFNRPALRGQLEERRPFFRGRTGQGGFLVMCLLPLLLSAFCLTTYYAWSREVNEGQDVWFWKFWLFGVGFTFLGWLIASVVLKRLRIGRLNETNPLELLGLLAVGLFGGTVIYVVAQFSFASPVIGYDKSFNWLTTDWLSWTTELYVCFAVPLFLLVFMLAIVIFIGFTSASRFRFVEDEDREWWARLGAWVLISIIVWVCANVLVIFGPIVLLWLPTVIASLGGLSGLVALLFGHSSGTPANEGEQGKTGKLAKLMGGLLPMVALFFITFLVVTLSLATSGLFQALAFVAPWIQGNLSSLNLGRLFKPDWLTNADTYEQYTRLIYHGIRADTRAQAAQFVHMNVLHHTWTWWVLAVGLVLFGFGMALARIINLNIFSLHGGYRNRLIRAFLGASRPDNVRKPNPFTGFDPSDNLHMHELRPALLDEGDFINSGLLARQLRAAFGYETTEPPARKDKRKGEEAATKETIKVEPNALSLRLVQTDWIKPLESKLKEYDPKTEVPPGLVAALRESLNSVLEKESLYTEELESGLLHTEQAAKIRQLIESDLLPGQSPSRETLRSDYHILLNRLVLERAYRGALKPSAYPPPPYKLMHVVNTTLNLVGGSNLAWQQRKAEPFSISPLHAGCFRVGYRNARDYGGRATKGISLGTAATVSGAAASSNMGYYTTSPLISLMLTLFNVRLGLWLGNPGSHGRDTYYLGSPRYSFKPVVAEAFGMTDDTNDYVYLTDGGHFENLALYEMVLRRCRLIVLSDGAQDENFRFGDLGNAVRKIRIDLGVPIEFTDMPIYPKQPPEGRGTYWAIAKIRYSCVDTIWDQNQQKAVPAPDGLLLYIKPTVYGDEPRDVLEYKQSFPAFPHQSTGDQFFDEPQFESYRMLGSHIIDRMCGEGREPLELRNMFGKAAESVEALKAR
ncbi:MAG TPA: patatin-like phospholipase family protein [Pyrinomonadaceae bacterium]|nr:patatin-like phospholipase family protein [Pyrinomonadaceae bacterium]